MSYQVLARKWRPRRFADVLGQEAVTRTLQNALRTGRLAHAFVFAGPRGCGKTTTARLLARALNCVSGPTPEPCGACEPCVEIAEGRDIDVLEIDAATHTGVDNVREVIIEGLAIAPVRDRYKVFVIDEVHMLSTSSFNALLKSLEEPPPHVVFVMATTELHRIPDTVLSRAQLHEFRTIPPRIVAERLRAIASEEGIEASDEALRLLARAGEGSMRDSLSALDQVRAFAGDRIGAEDVTTVLGLVGRDLVLDALEVVAAENAPAVFALVERAIERGYDLRLLCRELARAVRDLLIVAVDPARLADPDLASESERERVRALGDRFSREDLLRAFDVLTRAEADIRAADQPRFHLEMALLRLMYLRQLVPLEDLVARIEQGGGPRPPSDAPPRGAPTAAAPAARPRVPAGAASPAVRPSAPAPPPGPAPAAVAPGAAAGGAARDRLLAEIKAAKVFFYNTVVAQASRIDVAADGVTFTFQPHQKVPRQQCEDARPWLAALAEKVLGRRVPVAVAVAGEAAPPPGAPATARPDRTPPAAGARGDEALEDELVQAVLDVFPTVRSTVQEIEET